MAATVKPKVQTATIPSELVTCTTGVSSRGVYSRPKSDPPVPIEPLPPCMVGHDQCAGTVPEII